MNEVERIQNEKSVGKVSMKDLNQMSLCQTLWARNKYLVLSHSSNIYLEIRQYLKSESVEVAHVQALIDQAIALPENRGQRLPFLVDACSVNWLITSMSPSMSSMDLFITPFSSSKTRRLDRKSTRLNSSNTDISRMPSSA